MEWKSLSEMNAAEYAEYREHVDNGMVEIQMEKIFAALKKAKQKEHEKEEEKKKKMRTSVQD